MKLSELLKDVTVKETVGGDAEVRDITTDSNAVVKGSLFICIKGGNYNGGDFIRQVENYGGVAVVTQEKLDTSLTQVIVSDARTAVCEIAAAFYGNAHKKMKIIGVTGTNGKTTTTHFITSILTGAGIKCGLIGTLGVFYDGKFLEPTLTTPDPIELHRIFYEMALKGVEAVIMEISAHAAFFNKLHGIKFEVGVFTNLTQDHLDFFGDMKNYKKAKLSFFDKNECRYIVANGDDKAGREIAHAFKQKAITFGILSPSDIFAIVISESDNGCNFILNLFDAVYKVTSNLIGRYNVYNALAAATASALYGVSTYKVAAGIEGLKGISGRLECVYEGDFSVYVDYAHTPDGLSESLKTLKKHAKNRLICLFGCGGNRDAKKRPIMGKISGRLADFTVITSDNPRYEEPMDIIWQVEEGLKDTGAAYVIVQDREEAINYALKNASRGDVVLIAGKGSEKYQDVFGVKRPFNDKEKVERYIRGLQ